MVLYWRRYGRVGGCRIKKEKKETSGTARLEKKKDDFFVKQYGKTEWKEFGKEEEDKAHVEIEPAYISCGYANRHQHGNAVCINWFHQWFEGKTKGFMFEWLMKQPMHLENYT